MGVEATRVGRSPLTPKMPGGRAHRRSDEAEAPGATQLT
jgi:hypothetical protein